jgi:hypothetical protein
MKKLFFIVLAFGFLSTAQSQFLNFGIKGGLNYNSNGNLRGISDYIDDIKIKSDEGTGYHFGVFTEIKIPFVYIRPEFVYTHTLSDYSDNVFSSELTINKVDLPILVGIKILQIGRIFAGPSFQYILNTDFKDSSVYDNVREISSDDFSMGMQLGIGVELGKLGADIRWEKGISDTEARFIGDLVGSEFIDQKISIDTRPEQFIISVYYKFK